MNALIPTNREKLEEFKKNPVSLVEIMQDKSTREIFLNLFPETQPGLFAGMGAKTTLIEGIRDLLEGGIPLYNRFKKKDKYGKERKIAVPKKPLQELFREYLIPFIEKQPIHPSCHNDRGRSAKSSVKSHHPSNTALSFDIEDAAQNMKAEFVFAFFYNTLEHLPEGEARTNIAGVLTLLTTIRYRDSNIRGLTQGGSHTKSLSNRLLYGVDARLHGEAQQRGLRYSRWGDDFIFTSPERRGLEDFLGAVELVDRELPVSRTKTYFQQRENGKDLYLLGHIILSNSVIKNSREEAILEKGQPLKIDELLSRGRGISYDSWLNHYRNVTTIK